MGPAGADSEVLAKSPGRDPAHRRRHNQHHDHRGVPDHIRKRS